MDILVRIISDLKNKTLRFNTHHYFKFINRQPATLVIVSLVIIVAIFNLLMFSKGRSYADNSLMAEVLVNNPQLNSQLASKLTSRIMAFEKNEQKTEEDSVNTGNIFIKTAQAANLADGDLGDKKPFEYEVQGGDALSNIAERYNLKLNTILWANNLTAKSIIRPGQKIILLPVDGVLYTVKKGDNVSKIAVLHESDSQKIIDYNGITDPTKIHAGDAIIIPDGHPLPQEVKPKTVKPNNDVADGDNLPDQSQQAPTTTGKLIWPTTIKNLTQKYSAKHRGLDIANGGQPPIYASHSGQVEFAGKSGDWGNTILIRGDDGLVTRYSHNAENYVKAGDRVEAGDPIGKIGNTGRVRGATGLHLDFRIYKNGVAVNPMKYF